MLLLQTPATVLVHGQGLSHECRNLRCTTKYKFKHMHTFIANISWTSIQKYEKHMSNEHEIIIV